MRPRLGATKRGWLGGAAALVLLLLLVSIAARLVPPAPRATLESGKETRPREFSPDGRLLATYEWDHGPDHGPIRVWDTHSGELLASFEDGGTRVSAISFSPDSRLLAARAEGRLKVWDVKTGAETLNEDLERRRFYGFTPDGRFLIFWRTIGVRPDTSERVDFWEIETKRVWGTIEGEPHLHFSPDGHSVAVIDEGDHFSAEKSTLWKLGDREGDVSLLRQINLHARRAALSPEGTTLASVRSSDADDTHDQVTLWDTATGAEQCSTPYEAGQGWIYHLSFRDNGRMLVAKWRDEGRNYRTILWDLGAGLDSPVTIPGDVEVSPDGKWWARSDGRGVTFGRTTELQQGPALSTGDGFRLKFSPDSTTLTQFMTDANEEGWDAPDWLPFNPFPRRTGGYVLRLCRVSDGRMLLEVKDPGDGSQFSADGKTFVTTEQGRTTRLWDVPPRKPSATIAIASVGAWLTILVVIHLCRRYISRRREQKSSPDPSSGPVVAGEP
jgi:hypothetical protein